MKKFFHILLVSIAVAAIASAVGFIFLRNGVAPVDDKGKSDGVAFEVNRRGGEPVVKVDQPSSSVGEKKRLPAFSMDSEKPLVPSKAISMFQEAKKCVNSYRAMQALEFELKRCETDASWHDSSSCIESQRRAASELPQLRNEAERCEGIGTKAFDDLRFDIIANAAKLGDIDAQVCYVQSDFDLRNSDKFSESTIEQYKADATRYVDSGMARGDWRIPILFAVSDHALSHDHGLFPTLMVPRDELTRYRMMRLLRYGAVGSYASTLDTALAEYTEARANGLRGYPPEQLAAADEWARQQYEKSFANSPPLEGRPKICAD